MKKVLGLDLGVGSVGWSLIEADDSGAPQSILAMGSRIVPLTPDDANEFSSGNAISKNQKRTQKRTQRKGYDRYQQRRLHLTEKLRELKMLPDESLIKLPVMELWQLRADAATEGKQLTLPQIGRVLYHINQKRGYRHAKSDDTGDKGQRDYVQAINNRHALILAEGKTIGQYFAGKLRETEILTEKGKFYTFRIKEQVFPRKAYEEEFDKVMECQRKWYPDILTEENIRTLRNEIIFYQRPLKSCKHLVSKCDFSLHEYKTSDGKAVISGPKVAPRSSPLFQVCKIWESVNNLDLRNRNGETFPFTPETRKMLFDFLDCHEKLTVTDLYQILGLSKKDGWWGGKAIGKGLQGNVTKMALAKALGGKHEELLRFNLQTVDSKHFDTETGVVLQEISPDFEKEPLYRLWHIVYSMSNPEEMAAALGRQFGLEDPDIIAALSKLDFVKPGYGNKSSRFIRSILPYLQMGEKYSYACDYIGINHSNSLTVAENNARQLLPRLPQLQKNELRQPVIEKILNQMVNVVNALLDKYGCIDEMRVELARELKQSKEERNSTWSNINKREKENKVIQDRIIEMGVRPSRNRIQKYRLWEESKHLCFYCGQPVGVKEFLEGADVEIEHIVPRSLLFDDSFSNKVCACRKCNKEKNNRTAYDYMKQIGGSAFDDYLRRIEEYYNKKEISKTKRDRLMTPASEIPQDFIDRQLRQSQYISKKAVEILKQVCRNVWTTSGSVTDFARHLWGYDQILHDLNFPRYKAAGMTKIQTVSHKGQDYQEERILNWTKRLDHRHHAIDALTIASTKQSYVQRLNALNASRDAMFKEISEQSPKIQNDRSLLENWMKLQPHISVQDVTKAVDGLLISFKSGKKVTTPGKRYIHTNRGKVIAQEGIVVPRGALSEESVYGSIHCLEEKVPLKRLFEHPELIFKQYIKEKVLERIAAHNGDKKAALASLKKNPVYLDESGTLPLEYASCWKKEYVFRYPIGAIKKKDIDFIVDGKIREIIRRRIEAVGEKDAFKEPVFADADGKIPIRHVRLFTGLSAVEPVKFHNDEAIGFVKPGNNHHIALYLDKEGNLIEHVVSFWHAVERKKYGLPVIIKDTDALWDEIINRDLPESFLKNLPPSGLTLKTSLQQNEMFVLGMPEDDFQHAMEKKDTSAIKNYLYRVQKIGASYYTFRFHIETQLDDSKEALSIHKFYRVRSISALSSLNPHKVSIGILGEIIKES
ncbi:MAG: type II CRISPR RNA-guided endonuclease Cas9 [Bacteroidales bacterium]|nr:type II CRISPR RNA-guided endonuclease Cas9 [Bacteroidales bacterium]